MNIKKTKKLPPFLFRNLLILSILPLLYYGVYKIYWDSAPKPYLTVVGYVNMSDGLGRQSVELINALKDSMSINFISTGKNSFQDVPPKVKKIIKQKSKDLGKVVIFEDCIWRPGEPHYKHLNLAQDSEHIQIAYSMIEATRIPSEWVIILNLYFDAVVVPDKFLIDVYKNSGVTIPIFELPLGLELNNFLAQPIKKHRSKPMVFANLGAGIERKNHLLLIQAFAKAFGNNPDVLLKINCRYADEDLWLALNREAARLGVENIQISQLCLDKNEYLKFFQTIDCYVSFSKAEGFSIQPREAMALGIPTIVTDNTAQETVCQSNLVKIVSSQLKEPAFYPWGGYCGFRFNCSTEDAVQALLDVYNNYDSYLQKSEASRKWVTQYDYKNLKPYYRSLVKPKKILLGQENKIGPDYLMTNSSSLYEKYKKNAEPI